MNDTLQGHHKMLNKITGVTAAAVVGIAATVAGAQSGAVQWKVEDGGNGHWYARNSQPMTWAQATASATATGGTLATTTTQLELAFVRLHLIADGVVCWLGGTIDCSGANDVCCTDCVWRWSNGETFDLSWYGWNPDNGYATERLVTNGTGFDDMCSPCSVQDFRPPSIIEWSADCNSDGIVDYGQCHDGTLADYNGNNIPDCCEQGTSCAPGSYPVQWRVEDGGNGHWYDQRIWTGPKAIVEISASYVTQVGAHAVTITSPSENEFVYRAVHSRTSGATHDGYSILGGYQDSGASDYVEPAGGWRWVTGEPMTYLNWGPRFPDNCCYGESVLQYPSASYWNDAETAGVPAGHRYRVIVEWEADCNNDNIVDYGQILTGQLADSNTNGIPDVCEQPQCQDADITNNHIIDGADLGALLAFWGPVNPVLPQADINHDGQVNGSDLGILLSYWGPCP